MSEIKKQKTTKKKKTINIDLNKMGLDADKREYQEIVLSNSNFPYKCSSKQNYYN